MPKLPIDVKDILNATKATSKASRDTVRIALLVEDSASDELVDIIRELYTPKATNALMHVEAFSSQGVVVDGQADLVVIAAGRSADPARIIGRLAGQGLNAVIATDDVIGLSDAADASGISLPLDDVVYLDSAADDPKVRFTEDMASWIVEHLEDRRLPLAAAFPFIRKALAEELTRVTAFQNACVGAILLIPGADMPIMTLNQVKLVLEIAGAYGFEIGFSRAKEIAVIVAGGFGWRAIARGLVKVVPAFGWAARAGVGYSGTLAIGSAATRYFADGGDPSRIADVLMQAYDGISEGVSRIGIGAAGSDTDKVKRRAKDREAQKDDIDAKVESLSGPLLTQVVKVS